VNEEALAHGGGGGCRAKNNLETRLTEVMEEVEWLLRTAIFWAITHRVVVITYRRSGQPIGPVCKGGPIDYPETSVRY